MIRENQEVVQAPIEESDFDIVEKVLTGQKNEYRILVKRYQDLIFRMLLKQTGESSTAHDLAQETFIKAFENLSSFRKEAQFLTWITRIAINLANNYFSSREYKTRLKLLQPIDPEHSEPNSSHSTNRSIEERLVLLREFISALKPKLRNVVTLCGLEKKSYEEAAQILEIPVGTVRSRLHEARLQLKERFLMEARDL